MLLSYLCRFLNAYGFNLYVYNLDRQFFLGFQAKKLLKELLQITVTQINKHFLTPLACF